MFGLADAIGILFAVVVVLFFLASLYELLGGLRLGGFVEIRPVGRGEDVSHLMEKEVRRRYAVRWLEPERQQDKAA